MLKNITINNTRWIELSKELSNLNFIKWWNWAWKSTFINLINDIYKWKTTIKEWVVTIIDDSMNPIIMEKWVIHNSPALKEQADLSFPWFFMNKETKGINLTKEDKRKTVSTVLGIDREEFFKSKWLDFFDVKWIKAEIKTKETQAQTLWAEIIEKENSLKDLVVPAKPRAVTLKESNSQELELLKSRYEMKEKQLYTLKDNLSKLDLSEPKEVVLSKTQNIKWNENEIAFMKKELEDLKVRWTKLKQELESLNWWICPCCKQSFKDDEAILEKEEELLSLRKEYARINKELTETIPVKTEIIKWNEVEYATYNSALQQYKRNLEMKDSYNEQIIDLEDELIRINKSIKEFKLIKWNSEEYNKYNILLNEYNKAVTLKESLEEDIKNLEIKISNLSTEDLEAKLNLYKETEKQFIDFCEDKLRLDEDTKFIFYRKLKSPNTNWDEYESDFNIEYKWKLYSECSAWEKWYIDILIAKMFIDSFGIQDFILIDNAELSTDNLNKIIKEQLEWFQVFATRITEWELKIESVL